MNAGIAAYVILTQNTDVTDIVGVNIFPEVAEQETATPFIVYQLQSVAPEDTHDGPSKLDEVRFEFLCYADTYALAADLGDKVRGALDRVSGTYNGVNVESVQFNDVDIDTIDAPRRFAQVLTFTFRIKRDNFTIAQGTPVTGAKIGDLYDVDVTGVTDGQVLAYDASVQEWQPADGMGGAEALNDLSDVDIISPVQGSVISYNSGSQEFRINNGLQELLQRFKASGTGAQIYDTLNDTTKGYIDILAASATMKVNHSGLTISEASPGVISFLVAAGTDGNEVEFEAMTIEGSDAVSTVADINFKQGALTYWENATGKIWLRAPNAGNITVLLPSSGGTLALTTDIPSVPVDSVNGQTGVVVLDTGDIDENGNLYYTEARVAANSAVAANTAKVGITTQQASDITANNAKIAAVADDTSPQLGGNLGVNGHEIQSNGDLEFRIDADNNTPLSKFVIKDGTGTSIYTIDEEGTTIATTGASNNVKIGNLNGSLGAFNGISLNNNLTYPGIVGFAGGSATNSNFFCFGEVIDFRAGGATDASMRIVEDSTDGTQVVINYGFPVPTTHNFAVNGTGLFEGNVDLASGCDVTGNITVTGTVDGVDIADSHASYEEDELKTGRNTLMNSSVSVASNKIVDIMGNALADTSNANSKKFLGFHTGSGVCVLQGMVDVVNSISGATAGSALWIGASGAFSATAPTTINYYSRVVGHYIGTGQGGEELVYFNPSQDFTQIS